MNQPPRDPPRTLDEALDELPPSGGTAQVSDGRGTAEVELAEVDRLGVRVRGVKTRFASPRDLGRTVEELPDRLRPLGDELEAVEVDPVLGGGVLRSCPEELTRGPEPEFFEVEVRPSEVDVRRYQVDAQGERRPADWVMTRDGLRRLIDQVLSGDGDEP